MRRIMMALLALLSFNSVAQAADAVRFISCPVYRDTDAGRKSGCWLAEERETGRRFDITQSATKPDWSMAVLVEGRIADKQDNACGSVVLEPVRVSILPAQACTRVLIPAEGFPGRRFVLPARNIRPLYAPEPAPPPPYTAQLFPIPFDFGRDFVVYQQSDWMLVRAATYAKASGGNVVITGYAETEPVHVSGQSLAEPAALGKTRAEMARLWLVSLGVPANKVRVEWKQNPAPLADPAFDGLTETSRRRVDIQVMP
ncbi:hypothetical protein [Niveispirillum cyanobacteriorum]|uniref:OmpA-like domain-containing protein n=1 Tax=Niveispirillum cyanobacteriorum TaxID=1612173 RepID=A0A2K9NGK8_9PROT|nr:hypothetical protein [Niveispirillum cyanobacteriorum]AUN32241.1 hypothetical protein C0V82_17750 [Niveispirillum cyanobacteriorum]